MSRFWWLFAAFVVVNAIYGLWKSSKKRPGGDSLDALGLEARLEASRAELSERDFQELGRLAETIRRHDLPAGLTCFEIVAIGLCSLAILLGRGVTGIVLFGLIVLSLTSVGIALYYRWHSSRDQNAFLKIFEARLREAMENPQPDRDSGSGL